MAGTVVIFAGGEPLNAVAAGAVPAGELIIAADSGLDEAVRLGFEVGLLVGDLDSTTASAVAHARRSGIRVVAHPADKDQTDLELAIEEAMRTGPARLVVAGGGGGRTDHLFANLQLLSAERLAPAAVEWVTNEARLHVVRRQLEVSGRPGDLVSLLPLGGNVSGVITQGLRWELHGETLVPGSTRGVSNRFLGSAAKVEIAGGTLLVILPFL